MPSSASMSAAGIARVRSGARPRRRSRRVGSLVSHPWPVQKAAAERHAQFSGGRVNFTGARFSGDYVSFIDAQFSGSTVDFESAIAYAEFSGGKVNFLGAQFSGGRVSFGAQFSGGEVSFREAKFSGGRVYFFGARFSGGTVDFSGVADWSRPPEFNWKGTPPSGVKLPAGGS
jgi:hypothetical protein